MGSSFGEPASANYTPPDGLKTLGNIMSLQKQKQDIQSGALTIQGQVSQNQSLAAKAQGDTQDMQERAAVTQMMKSGKDDQGNDIGSRDPSTGQLHPDPSKLLTAIGRIAPKTGQAYVQSILKSQTDMVGFQAASQALDSQGRALLMGPLQAAAVDPKASSATVIQGIDNLVAAHPELGNAANYLKGLAPHLDAMDPKTRVTAIQGLAARMQGGQPVQTQSQPGTVDTGGEIQPGTVAPAAAGGGFAPSGLPIAKTIAPGAVPVTDANNHSFVLNPKTNTVNPMGAGNARGPAGPNAPQFVQPTADAATVQKNIASARDAGDQAPLNQHINDQLIRLSNDTATGYGTQKWHEAVGALSGGKFGSDYQTIGAYLDRQAAMSSRSMGLPDTNAGLAASQSLSGHTGYAKDALQTKVKLADTLNTAAQQYRQGLDRVVGVGTNQDNSKYEAYRSAWAKNFDPQVFAAENALRRGDKAELEKIQKEEGPRGMQELAAKTQALRGLANGQLPQ